MDVGSVMTAYAICNFSQEIDMAPDDGYMWTKRVGAVFIILTILII